MEVHVFRKQPTNSYIQFLATSSLFYWPKRSNLPPSWNQKNYSFLSLSQPLFSSFSPRKRRASQGQAPTCSSLRRHCVFPNPSLSSPVFLLLSAFPNLPLPFPLTLALFHASLLHPRRPWSRASRSMEICFSRTLNSLPLMPPSPRMFVLGFVHYSWSSSAMEFWDFQGFVVLVG